MTFKDHFSVAQGYGRFRPGYPADLFEFLAERSPGDPTERVAWDCGTGSGQSARGLAPYFARVLGTDPSLSQLARAYGDGVRFAAGRAEAPPLADAGVELVTIAQALHWFHFDSFYAEVRRVLRPGGIVAAWTYPLLSVSPEIDKLTNRFENRTVGAYWPVERAYVDANYETIPFPFERVAAPSFHMHAHWTMDHVLGYFGTWSAVNRYRREHGRDPLVELEGELAGLWGDPARARRVTWPLPLLVGRVD